ncbi:hypothetical protein F5050DRAFT_1714798 [Lentinula boryana]|uniref:DUF6532 domain-containing protein n=1 Tax=Lentinula boryana TaxID=40481 RepID=A0ABQ8Q3S9_9AGAR|nr:hypothetical protein F5050DRAFT_1714798 [Lentinula boryana]
MHHGTLPRKWWCTLEYNLHLGLYPVSCILATVIFVNQRHLVSFIQTGVQGTQLKVANLAEVRGQWDRRNAVNKKSSKVTKIHHINVLTRLATAQDMSQKNDFQFVQQLTTFFTNFWFTHRRNLDLTQQAISLPCNHYCAAQTIVQSGTDDTKEIPSAMLTLVIIGIFAALKEWEEGKDQHEEQYFASTTFADIVGLHNALLIDKIRDAKVGNGAEKYHILMARLYCDAKAGKGISVALNQVPDVDLEGMV